MRWFLQVAFLVLPAAVGWAQTDPVQAVIAAFDRVNLVALGEGNHLSERDLEFRLRLIREPAFTRKANDIVIEFANAMHQSILDRFTNGEDIGREQLDKVWTVTNQKSAYAPFYQQFVDAVRAVNMSLSPDRRLRVIAGDGAGRGRRDQIAADQIRREVLDKNRRALVVFGALHLLRNRPGVMAEMFPVGTIVMLLQNDPRARWFVVQPLGGADLPPQVTVHAGTPERPVLISDRTALDMDATAVGWADHPNEFRVRDLADALLYFGRTAPLIRSLR
jgi:hypothetical protein